MNAIDYIIVETQKALTTVIERARKVPADKLEWSPLDEGRTVLNIVQECTHSVLWPVELIETRKFEMNEEVMAKYKAECAEWSDLDKCEAAMTERFETLKSCLAGLTDSQLEEKIAVPWGDMSVLGAADITHWNCLYHTGQINYIQTLYGDKDMM